MAPDAVIRLIEGAHQVGSGIGQREAFPAAYVVKTVNGVTRGVVGIRRQELQEIELGRRLEQYPVLVRSLPSGVLSAQAAYSNAALIRSSLAASSSNLCETLVANVSSEKGVSNSAASF